MINMGNNGNISEIIYHFFREVETYGAQIIRVHLRLKKMSEDVFNLNSGINIVGQDPERFFYDLHNPSVVLH
jgi:hypothetical protein